MEPLANFIFIQKWSLEWFFMLREDIPQLVNILKICTLQFQIILYSKIIDEILSIPAVLWYLE